MAKELLTGENKIKQISDLLKEETLLPAKKQAAEIVEEAKKKAKEIVAEAELAAKNLIKRGQEELAREKAVFETSMIQGADQCFESLKQKIQGKLFNDQLHEVIHREAVKSSVIADLIQAIVSALQKEGVDAKLEAVIARSASPADVNRLLGEEILRKLQGGGVVVGSIGAGAQVKLLDKQLTLDVSDQSLKELLANYLRKDFRELLFKK